MRVGLFSSKALILYRKQILLEQLIKAGQKISHCHFLFSAQIQNEIDTGFCWIFSPWFLDWILPFLSQGVKIELSYCSDLTLEDLKTVCPHHSFWGGSPRISHKHSVSHSVGRRGSLGALGEMVWPWTMACEIPALNLYQGVFWPALIYAYQISWAFILHLSQLFSVTDFSGISQCADQQEGGAAELDFSDQGQLHLRSLTLCSLSSAPLLITAHVFPAECKGVTVSLENDACVDLQSKRVMGNP